MPLIRYTSAVLAALTLIAVWFSPLLSATHSFAAHMTMHIAVVALAAPLIGLAVAGSHLDPVRRMPNFLPPIPISMIEFVVVWGWHTPALHDAARRQSEVWLLEQASFFGAGTLLWLAALGGDHEQRRVRAGSGVAALLFTSMHVTLLGALFALSGRPLFGHGDSVRVAAAVSDQQLGGVIMLLVGGACYLAGGLWLTAVVLRPTFRAVRPAKERSV
jgi:putative membrane protein